MLNGFRIIVIFLLLDSATQGGGINNMNECFQFSLLNVNYLFQHYLISSGPFFEASLGAHLFICKINFHSHENEFNLPCEWK